MMTAIANKIQILPENIINKIAAGEVVERPASVVKELVENSIDAFAGKIEIVVNRAGKELIKVIDNGMGMSPGDAVTAFERHATSKIKNEDSLTAIETLGFRGEALASIAAVSMVEMKTRRAEDELGVRVRINGGVMEERTPVAMNPGTQISVKNLFYNIPARRAFLKSDQTENFHILRTVKRIALSKPEISFKYYSDDKIVFDFPAETLEERIKKALEIKDESRFIKVDTEFSGLKLYGFIAKPEFASGDRQSQYLFLNGRFIISKNINYAVFKSYGEMIPPNLYPPFILYLSLDPSLVDVNVHPTKMEVRFANEKVILNFIRQAIRKALGMGNVIPLMDDEVKSGESGNSGIFNQFKGAYSGVKRENVLPTFSGNREKKGQPEQLPLTYGRERGNNAGIIASGEGGKDEAAEESRAIWQFKNSYIFSELRSGLIIVDQHRAHVRILYEKIIKNRESRGNIWSSQQLLFPQNIDLSMENYLIYREIRPYLQRLGFIFSELSGRTIVLEAIPVEVKTGKETNILLEIIEDLKEEKVNPDYFFDKFAIAFSKRNAIQKGEKLRHEAIVTLLDMLFDCEQPNFTPDGKPIIVTMGIEELERKFK